MESFTADFLQYDFRTAKTCLFGDRLGTCCQFQAFQGYFLNFTT